MREAAARAVQWQPARNAVKYAVHAAARVRGEALRRAGRLPEVANLFVASSPKSGSQWSKALLDHPVVRAHTGLLTLPQLDYQQLYAAGHRRRPLPLGTFVPGLYLAYEEYLRIPRPLPHRTVYIFRDPRDVVVSGYFSGLETHRELPGIDVLRARLRRLSVSDGLMVTIEEMAGRLREMQTWVDVRDPSVATFHLEQLGADPEVQVARMLEHCGVRLTGEELAVVLGETSRESLQRKDLAHRHGGESHYRVHRQGFRELLEPRHLAAIESVVPGLVERLGYPA